MKFQSEREEEIERLLALKPKVPRWSKFGDDHHAAIDAQIWVLETNPTEMLLDAEAAGERWCENVHDAAIEALRWLDWQDYTPPSEDWRSLLPQTSPTAPAGEVREDEL